MILSDLMKRQMNPLGYKDAEILQGNRTIALDARDGKVLFDTRKNKPEYIEQYMDGIVVHIWASAKERYTSGGFGGTYFEPTMMIYLSHDSWLKEQKND